MSFDFRPSLREKTVQARLLAPSPPTQRGAPLQIADDDPIVVALAEGDLIDADGARGRQTGTSHLLLHIELVEFLHRTMMQTLPLGDRLVRHVAAQRAHMQGKALGIARILRQPVEMLYMHTLAPRTADAPTLELQINPPIGHREITCLMNTFVVTVVTTLTTVRTHSRFFAA